MASSIDALQKNLPQIVQYGQLSYKDAGALLTQISLNPHVMALIPDTPGDKPMDPKYKNLIQALSQRYTDDPTLDATTFPGKLNADLAKKSSLKK